MPRNIPYELEVEIVDDRDFSNFRVDIEDILKIIDKLDASYSETIEKVSLPTKQWNEHI